MAAISPVVESIAAVLVDNGYYSEAAVNSVEGQCTSRGTPVVYAATGRRRHGRSILELEDHPDPPAPPPGTATAEIMAHRLATLEGKALYGQRKQTVEPVFGIGLYKTKLEWSLVTLSDNVKRLFHMQDAMKLT